MNKKGGILGILVISIIIVIVASMSSSNNETFDVDMTRTHGSNFYCLWGLQFWVIL